MIKHKKLICGLSLLTLIVSWFLVLHPYAERRTEYTIKSKLMEYQSRIKPTEPHPISVIDNNGDISVRYLSIANHEAYNVGDRVAFIDSLNIVPLRSFFGFVLFMLSFIAAAILFVFICGVASQLFQFSDTQD